MAMMHLSPYAEHAAKLGLNIVVENTRLVPGIRQSCRYCQAAEELVEMGLSIPQVTRIFLELRISFRLKFADFPRIRA